jgi:hypothetical protein
VQFIYLQLKYKSVFNQKSKKTQTPLIKKNKTKTPLLLSIFNLKTLSSFLSFISVTHHQSQSESHHFFFNFFKSKSVLVTMPCTISVTVPSYAVTPFTFTSSKSTPISHTSNFLTKQNRKPLTVTKSMNSNRKGVVKVKATVSIEKETPETERPDTFLRGSDDGASSVRFRFEKMIREAQDSVCNAIEIADGGGKFKEDVWSRPGGGGGISRVLQDGAVWEKAGVNVSVVYGQMPPDAYRAAKGGAANDQKPGPIPFFAAGISSVSILTVHQFNSR